MKLNRRALAAVAATGVASGALAFGGVALASGNSTQSAAATTAAAAPAATDAPQPAPGWCDGGPGRMGLGYGMHAWPRVAQAAAAYLGLSQDQLLGQLESGKSLADVAAAQGKPVSGLKNAILAAGTSAINASGTLSAAQKAALISELKSHLDTIVNATFPDGPGMHGWMGGPGRGGWMMGGPRGV